MVVIPYVVDPILNKIIFVASSFAITWLFFRSTLARATINSVGYMATLTVVAYIAFSLWDYFIQGVMLLWFQTLALLLGKSAYVLFGKWRRTR